MSTPSYTLILTMSEATLQSLAKDAYSLYGFAGLGAPPTAETPVWFQTAQLAETLTLTWSDSYAAYTETTQSIPGGQITGMNSYPVQLGDTLTVTSPAGLGTVAAGGPAGTVTVVNDTDAQFTCGLALTSATGADPSPISAHALPPNQQAVMTPGTDIFLVFRAQVSSGTVTASSTSAGVLIPYPQGTATQTVTYDADQGWSGAGTVYPPEASADLFSEAAPQ